MRKHYLDNIRFVTIVLVVIFHVFFYYNNIGVKPLFMGLEEYTGQVSAAGVFQYFVYPWFMLLLFIVSGMSARIALSRMDTKSFFKARVNKVLVPSTLGVLTFGVIGGYFLTIKNASTIPEDVPVFVKGIIAVLSGIGALWFCHVLFVGVILLILVRFIIRKCKKSDDGVCAWFAKRCTSGIGFVITMVVVYFVFWGGSHILNMPMVTSYRNGIYLPAFLLGYYLFSEENVIAHCRNMVLPFGILSVLTGSFYIYRVYGLDYTSTEVLSRWDLNLYAMCMILFILGLFARFFDVSNGFTEYMKKRSFGIYVFHIPVMIVVNYLLIGSHLPMIVIYMVELITALAGSLVLYEVVSRIPVFRYTILGIKKQR